MVLALGLLYTALVARAGVVLEEYMEREKQVCEPNLLERRVAETDGRRGEFLEALAANSVLLTFSARKSTGICSGTFITPTCVLTAAHCVSDLEKNTSIQAAKDGRLYRAARVVFDGDFRRLDPDSKSIGQVSGDDIGLVLFNERFETFRAIPLSSSPGNLSLWFHGADQPDAYYAGGLAKFDNGYWRDIGTLGLTGYTRPAESRPEFRMCSDAAFEWAPCFLYRSGDGTPRFERGVICTTGELGPGMSGGSFYNLHSLFGVMVEAPSHENVPSARKLDDHWWYGFPREFYSSNLNYGFANRIKILTARDRAFVLQHCPDTRFVPLNSSRGKRVRDPSLVSSKASNKLWLSGGTDVWRALQPMDRWSRISRPLGLGMEGEFVRRLQLRLKELKLLRGEISLQYDQRTVKAVAAFQQASGLTITGGANEVTLRKLGLWFNKRN